MATIEEDFREVAFSTTESASIKIEAAENMLKSPKYSDKAKNNFAGENFAFASELMLKANIIYDDFSKNPRFNQDTRRDIVINGRTISCYGRRTPEWHDALSAENDDRNFKIINNPLKTQEIIVENNPNDERGLLSLNNNDQHLSLGNDNGRNKGHSLFAFYQLQSPIAKSLIDAEYYTFLEDTANYTIYAILTEDILSDNGSGKTIMPKEFMDKLDANKDAAIKLRYASISYKDIQSDDLKFLREFSLSNEAVAKYRFSRAPESPGRGSLGNYLLDSLNGITKSRLTSMFSQDELKVLTDYLNNLLNSSDMEKMIFIYNCLYFKDYITNRLKIDLKFKPEHFGRIDNFCRLMKSYQPFASDSKRLKDNEAFDTKEKIDYYVQKMSQIKINTSDKTSENTVTVKDNRIYNYILLHTIGLNDNQIKKVMSSVPMLENDDVLINDSIVKYLLNQFNREIVVAIIVYCPTILIRNLKDISEQIKFVRELNWNDEKILKKSRQVFLQSIDLTKARYNFLSKTNNYSEDDLFTTSKVFEEKYGISRQLLIDTYNNEIDIDKYGKKSNQYSNNEIIENLYNIIIEELNDSYNADLTEDNKKILKQAVLYLVNERNISKDLIVDIVIDSFSSMVGLEKESRKRR